MTSSSTSRRRAPRPALVLLALLAVLLCALLVWLAGAFAGLHAAAQTGGTLHASGLIAPVQILRDERDIAHIRASNDRDLFYAQGYAEASDRLFQMDLLRRFVYGELAEIVGRPALAADEKARTVQIRELAQAQWDSMNARDRTLVQAFSDGANAAMRAQPLPAEFRLLVYRPRPWKPQDSLAVGMATALDLIDPWDDVIARDKVARATGAAAAQDLYSITDPAYDAPVTTRDAAPVPPLDPRAAHAAFAVPQREAIGSNEWAAGAARTAGGRALLANDPHLRLQIPGVWYLIDLRSPGMHVAGASLAGTPGVILGHNENIAWGATNGTVTTEVVYRDRLADATARHETFHVRFLPDTSVTYYQTRHGFVAQTDGTTAYAVDWNAVRTPLTALVAFEGLNRARTISGAIEALRRYPGPPQNFVLADRSGSVAYHLAGLVPQDPSWGLRVHDGSDPAYPFVPFDRLPHVDASRGAIVFTANNRMYGRGYPYRLTAFFEPPYRARRIEELLNSKPRLSVRDFTAFQNDTLSLPERELARELLNAADRKHVRTDPALRPYLDAVAAWNGRFDPGATGAPVVREVAAAAAQALAQYNAGQAQRTYGSTARPNLAANTEMVVLMRVLRERPAGWWPHSDYEDLLIGALRQAVGAHGSRLLLPWGRYDPIAVKHPLSALGFAFLNGVTLPGNGDSFSLHVQNSRDTQSFRAVWDVGNWDAGGIVIPSGESGEPASGHYTDQSSAWIAGRLIGLPFTDAAVRAATQQSLTLQP